MDELRNRLERIGEQVDVDQALTDVHATSRRRRMGRRTGVLAATVLVVVALLSTTMLVGGRDDDADLVAANPTDVTSPAPGSTRVGPGTSAPGTSVTPVEVAPPPSQPPASTASSVVTPASVPSVIDPPVSEPPPDEPQPSGVEVTITPESPTVAIGERLYLRVEVVNHGPSPVILDAGGCGPFHVGFGNAEGIGTSDVPVRPWDGAPASFGMFVATTDVDPPPHTAPRAWGSAGNVCPANLVRQPLAVGEVVSSDVMWDALVRPGIASPPTSIVVSAAVGIVHSPEDWSWPTAETTVELTGGDRVASADLAAFADNIDHHGGGLVAAWLATNQGVDVVSVLLGYQRGALVAVLRTNDRQLRIIGEPATGAITRITSSRLGAAPPDDPDALPGFKDPGEQVLFPT